MFVIGMIGNGMELIYEQGPPPGYSKLPYMKVRRREYWWGACEMFDTYCHAGWDYEELAHAHWSVSVLFFIINPQTRRFHACTRSMYHTPKTFEFTNKEPSYYQFTSF